MTRVWKSPPPTDSIKAPPLPKRHLRGKGATWFGCRMQGDLFLSTMFALCSKNRFSPLRRFKSVQRPPIQALRLGFLLPPALVLLALTPLSRPSLGGGGCFIDFLPTTFPVNRSLLSPRLRVLSCLSSLLLYNLSDQSAAHGQLWVVS